MITLSNTRFTKNEGTKFIQEIIIHWLLVSLVLQYKQISAPESVGSHLSHLYPTLYFKDGYKTSQLCRFLRRKSQLAKLSSSYCDVEINHHICREWLHLSIRWLCQIKLRQERSNTAMLLYQSRCLQCLYVFKAVNFRPTLNSFSVLNSSFCIFGDWIILIDKASLANTQQR